MPALLPASPPVVAVAGLTKRYGGVTVLDHVDLSVRWGEVRALLGENGAGKSTLIKILSGVVRADGGTVNLNDQPVDIHSAHAAQELGIATLHQELAIVPGATHLFEEPGALDLVAQLAAQWFRRMTQAASA